MAQCNYWVILDGGYYYKEVKRRNEQLTRNKNSNGVDRRQNWQQIKKRILRSPNSPITNSHATIDALDLCRIINEINFDESTRAKSDADCFFQFLMLCPKAAIAVTHLLAPGGQGETQKGLIHAKLETPKKFSYDKDASAELRTAKQKLESLYSSFVPAHNLFQTLLLHNQDIANEELLDRARNCAGGRAALLDFPKLAARKPLSPLSLGPSEIKTQSSAIDDALMLVMDEKVEFKNRAERVFSYLVKNYKADFKEHCIYQALFPALPELSTETLTSLSHSVIEHSQSPIRSEQKHRFSVSASALSPVISEGTSDVARLKSLGPRSPILTPVRTEATSSENKGVVGLKSPALRSGASARTFKAAISEVELQRVAKLKEYFKECSKNPQTNSLKDIFYQHPDIFYDFAKHANNEDLAMLLNCFPDPLRFLEQTRNKENFKDIIYQRIDQIALHLSQRLTASNNSFRKRFDAFFNVDNYSFRIALQNKFNLLAREKLDWDNDHKNQLLTMLRSNAIRDQLELHKNLDVTYHLLESLDTIYSAETNITTPSYAIGFELVRDQKLWQQLITQGNTIFIRWFKQAQEFLQDPSAFRLQTVTPPAYRFFFARYLLEQKGVKELVRNTIAKGGVLTDEIAYLIAFDSKLSKEFNSLGPKRSWLLRCFYRGEDKMTDTSMRHLNNILRDVWTGKEVKYPYVPPVAEQKDMVQSATSVLRKSSTDLTTTGQEQQLTIHASPIGFSRSIAVNNTSENGQTRKDDISPSQDGIVRLTDRDAERSVTPISDTSSDPRDYPTVTLEQGSHTDGVDKRLLPQTALRVS